MSRLITKNYSTSPKVPMGIQGLTWTPTSQMQGFGARPSSFQRTRIEKPLKIDKILTKMSILGRFRSSKSIKLWWSSTKPLILYCGGPSRPPDTHGYPGGGGVVFSNESGQPDVIPVSVYLGYSYLPNQSLRELFYNDLDQETILLAEYLVW